MDTVQVALRIRPLVKSEIDIGCRTCVERTPNEPQVTIGKENQTFTYNYVFDELEGQGKVYDIAVKSLIDNLFKGYNVTILAYGQTGSGKTYSMGTNYSGEGELGVIPRAVYDIFNRINCDVDNEFKVTLSFIELYNESLYDLLTQKSREQSVIEMREMSSGVYIPGLTELQVSSAVETLKKLKEGSSGRVVGATAMNAASSRSHAIFTVNIKIFPKNDKWVFSGPSRGELLFICGEEVEATVNDAFASSLGPMLHGFLVNFTFLDFNSQSFKLNVKFVGSMRDNVVNSKFHLVDLAGSERSKKTGTKGDRFKEGVNINKGLLVLGNVISQLGEGTHSYINYRDSKLTRLLQDSLGGNSVTLMIACISPADYNQDETLSTLRYADRARKIKNKPIVNQDPRLAEIMKLRKENEELRLQMIGGVLQCPPEHKMLLEENMVAKRKINELSKALGSALTQNTSMFEKTLSMENSGSVFREKLNGLVDLMAQTIPGDDSQWKDIIIKMTEVQEEQKKLDKEAFSLSKGDGKHNNGEDDEMDWEDHNDLITVERQEHIMQQAKINNEIMTLTKNLMWKEELVAKLVESNGHLGQMQNVSVENVEELKKQLAELQLEKEELLKQIKSASSHAQNASAKVAESRRKRLQELEAKVTNLIKKVTEQERIIKLKEKSEQKLVKLKQEIMSMKHLKVKLIQQMKSENEKFKTFKALKDREVCQLKNQNMKKQNELKRLEQTHIKQQNVLRRKLEAAAAANKRIMAALERQKAARDKRSKGSATEKIRDKLTEEFELLESEYQVQKSLDYLLQDRASLTKELATIKASLVDESISDEEKIKLKTNSKQLGHELELRSVEISDLQQKLMDINQADDHGKVNWDILQSMADAKFVLNHLFNVATEKLKENLTKSTLLNELMDQFLETEEQLEELKKKLSASEANHKKALERMEKECEEKVIVFMKVASENVNSREGWMSETFRIQTQELEKLQDFRDRIVELEEKNTELLFEIKNKNLETSNVPSSIKECKSTVPEKCPIDYDDDPDWKEGTPIQGFLNSFKQNLRKRYSPQIEKCLCIGRCESDCICLKTILTCNDNCSCDRGSCFSSSKRLKGSSEAIECNLNAMQPSRKVLMDHFDYFE